MQAAAAARREEAAAEATAVGLPSQAAPGSAAASGLLGTPGPQPSARSAGSPGAAAAAAATPASAARPQAKALGVFGRVWDFLIDEASYVEGTEGAPSVLLIQRAGSVGP